MAPNVSGFLSQKYTLQIHSKAPTHLHLPLLYLLPELLQQPPNQPPCLQSSHLHPTASYLPLVEYDVIPLLKALPCLLNACKTEANLLRMIQRPCPSSSVNFSPASFSAPLPFLQTLRGPGVSDSFLLPDLHNTLLSPCPFLPGSSTWNVLSLCPPCKTLLCFGEPTLNVKSLVKLNKSACFPCCITLCSARLLSDKYLLRPITCANTKLQR